MKRKLSVLLSVLFLLVVAGCHFALYLTKREDILNFELNRDNKSYFVSSVRSDGLSQSDIIIPSAYNGLPVTQIGYEAFSGCNLLQKIVIPDSVTTIGYAAFSGCTSLQSITVPDSVTEIGDRAFSWCVSLKSVTLGSGITDIGLDAFALCEGLTEINYNATACNTCSSDTFALAGRSSEGIKVNIGANVASVPEGLFWGCESIASVNFAENSACKSIGHRAFSGCASLQRVTVPDSVTAIGISAFSDCVSLTYVTLGGGVKDIESCAFDRCPSLAGIAVSSQNSVFRSAGNCLIETASKTLITGCRNSRIPADGSVTTIGGSAFSGCTSLTDIGIPDCVICIGDAAFRDCSSLASIHIPGSVTIIGGSAFHGCSSLASVTFEITEGWLLPENNHNDVDVSDPANAAYQLTNFGYSMRRAAKDDI